MIFLNKKKEEFNFFEYKKNVLSILKVYFKCVLFQIHFPISIVYRHIFIQRLNNRGKDAAIPDSYLFLDLYHRTGISASTNEEDPRANRAKDSTKRSQNPPETNTPLSRPQCLHTQWNTRLTTRTETRRRRCRIVCGFLAVPVVVFYLVLVNAPCSRARACRSFFVFNSSSSSSSW